MPTMPFCVVPLPLGTMTANTADTAHPVTHLNEFDTIGMTWKSGVALGGFGNAILSGDFGSAQTIDFVAVLQATAESGMTWFVELSNSATFATDVYSFGSFVNFISPSITRTDGLYNSHAEINAPVSARYWRISFAAQSGFLEAAAIIIGKKITPANWYSPGWKRGVKDLGSATPTPYGVIDLQPGRKFRTLDFTLGWMTESDEETLFGPLVEQIGNTTVAFWCFDPTANVYRQRRSYLGWLQGSPVIGQHTANTQGGPRFTRDFSILSMI